MEKALLLDLGTMPYGAAWDLQKQVWRLRVEGKIPDTLILVEHPGVITMGKSGKASNLLVSEQELKRRGIELFRVERGGDITYHGPGQLVGYPIFFIKEAIAGVHAFVTRVEESLIQMLGAQGIRAESYPQITQITPIRPQTNADKRRPGTSESGPPTNADERRSEDSSSGSARVGAGPRLRGSKLTGVWAGNDKVAAIGIAVSRRVSFHGFALNVNTDLSAFQLINPCGITDKGVTSMARLLGRPVSMPTVKHQVVSAFETVFGIELVLTSRERVLDPCPECYARGGNPKF
jgi:lipoyl(octanoyl) transferase